MLKTKYGLIIFKKIAFQFFYFVFVFVLICFFVKNHNPLFSVFELDFLFIEIFFMSLLLFYLNSIFFTKAMIVNKGYKAFFIKNIFLLLIILLVPFFLIEGPNEKMLPNTKYILLFKIFVYLFTLAASLLYSDWMYQIENKGAMYRLLKEKNKFEVELLKSQFSPHFLFNTLNSIYSKCHSTSPDAAKMIYDLSSFMRYLIYDCSSQRVLISKEVRLIQDYIKLYKLNYSESIGIEFKHKLFDEGQRIAPMLLLNFIENAFKHSQVGVSKGAHVKIELATDQDFLYFKIENNKVTLQNKLEKGVGNKNTLARLDLDYLGQYEYEVTDVEKLYTVNLKIRL